MKQVWNAPTNGRSGLYLNNGWNLDFRSGYNVRQYFLTNLDFPFNRPGLSSLALARADQPGGYADVWSLTLAPVVRLTPKGSGGVYLSWRCWTLRSRPELHPTGNLHHGDLRDY